MTDLLELADRVEAGKPSWTQLDQTFNQWSVRRGLAREAVKGSLDAAQALHEAVLVGLNWNVCRCDDGTFLAHINTKLPKPCLVYGEAPNPAAAWVAAILRAKASTEDD